MKILVATPLPEFALDELRGLGSEVTYEPALTTEELAARIGDVGILVVEQTAVTADTLSHATALQMIVVAASGSGQVAVDEASAQGIIVSHCPDRDAIAQAELALGLLLALDRDIVDNAATLREGTWDRARFMGGQGLAGRTLGIIAGRPFCEAMVPRAQAMDMRILIWHVERDGEGEHVRGAEHCNWPRELARRSDVIVVHAPVGDVTEPIIDADFLECLSSGTLLVHVGETSTLDEGALLEALAERNLKVALDVHPNKPTGEVGRIRSPLLQHPNVIGTHHVGGITSQARHAVATEVVRIVANFLVNGELVKPLNLVDRSPATWQLVLRLRDQVGVMAAVLDAVRADGINAEEITSRVFVGAKAAWCTIALDERPSMDALNAIRSLDNVLHLELRAVV